MQAPALEQFFERLLKSTEVKGLVFDLRSAEWLDSTNLGLLARFSDRLHSGTDVHDTILANRPDVTDVLHSMGLDEMFQVESEAPLDFPEANGEEVVTHMPEESELRKSMLGAHRRLLALNCQARDEVALVAARLEDESS
jgi:anti-anti-sigma regulatory factor